MATLLEHTVMPSGGDFTSVSAAIEHIKTDHADLTLADVYAEVKIDGTWSSADTTAVAIENIVTDVTRNLKIYTTVQARHDGRWDTGAHWLSVDPGLYGGVVELNSVEYVHLDGLQVGVSASGNSRYGIHVKGDLRTDNANATWISNCVAKGVGGTARTLCYGLYINGDYADVHLWNSVLFNNRAGGTCYGVYAYASGGSLAAYSSTIIGGEHGLRRSLGTVTAKNIYAGGSVSSDFYGTMTKAACASSDLTGNTTPDDLTEIPVSTSTFVNVTPGSEDFNLVSGSPLIGKGTDTSGEGAPLNFTTDIVGTARGSVWDVGAFEFVVTGSLILKIINE